MIKQKNLLLKAARQIHYLPGLFICVLLSCTPEKHRQIEAGFYFWKTELKLKTSEKGIIRELPVHTLYLRLFDIVMRNGKPLPAGMLRAAPVEDTVLNYVPVVFITQSCLYDVQESQLPDLAQKTAALMRELSRRYQLHPAEIQIDCDWTAATRARYFRLLSLLKAQPFFKSRTLSCTIRMHQVKYLVSSGIPPVDKGLLMVYNMGDLKKFGGQNSIFEEADARRYVANMKQYPLPLDIALPLYHWAVLFKGNSFRGIVYNISRSDFDRHLLQHLSGNMYRVQTGMRVAGYDFPEGTAIRFEAPGKKELERIARFMSDRLNQEHTRVSFFHLDSASLSKFSIDDMRDILDAFRK